MDRDAVRAAFVREYGSQAVLAIPMDTGFNRLAWLFPYLLGATGAAAVGFVAFRWSRQEGTATTDRSDTTPTDPTLQARLDDELRDLD
jgi:cytochrome c-type biogenesis protein CcmH/NrfF